MTIYCDMGHYGILRSLAAQAHSYLEIGVREGGSLMAALESPSILRVLLCDTWGRESGGTGRGSHDHISKLLGEIEFAGVVTFIDGVSQDVIWPEHGEWDLVNVDGSHVTDDALADMRNLWPQTLHAMVVHDISFPDVWEAVLAFAREGLPGAIASAAFGDQGTLVFHRKAQT